MDTNERGHIRVDYGAETSREGVFAAGDALTGAGSVISAIASGREAAMAVDRFLGGDGVIDEPLAPVEPLVRWIGREEDFASRRRSISSCNEAEDRWHDFREVLRTLDEDTAVEEARRCLQCDLRLKITPVKFWGEY